MAQLEIKEWTVEDLRQFLSHLPADAKLRISDPDTSWTIPKMGIMFDTEDNELWIWPCDYSEMTND